MAITTINININIFLITPYTLSSQLRYHSFLTHLLHNGGSLLQRLNQNLTNIDESYLMSFYQERH